MRPQGGYDMVAFHRTNSAQPPPAGNRLPWHDANLPFTGLPGRAPTMGPFWPRIDVPEGRSGKFPTIRFCATTPRFHANRSVQSG